MKNNYLVLYSFLVILISGCDTIGYYNCQCDTSHISYNDSLMKLYYSDPYFFGSSKEYRQSDSLHKLSGEVYRLEMTHSFSRYVQCYTVTKADTSATLEVLEYYRDSLYNIQLQNEFLVQLSRKDWNIIRNEINSTCFWTYEIGKDQCRNCLDGGSWRLEGFDSEMNNCAKRAHKIDVCDFESKGELGNLCRTIRKYAREEELHVYGTPQGKTE